MNEHDRFVQFLSKLYIQIVIFHNVENILINITYDMVQNGGMLFIGLIKHCSIITDSEQTALEFFRTPKGYIFQRILFTDIINIHYKY